MRGQLSKEIQVRAPARMVWDVYRGLEIVKLIDTVLSDVIGKAEQIKGDGGVGTVLIVACPPGISGFGSLKEIFTMIDDEKRIKETEIIEGVYKELGFYLYRTRIEIIEKDDESTIIKLTIVYVIDEKFSENVSLVITKPHEVIAKVVERYLN